MGIRYFVPTAVLFLAFPVVVEAQIYKCIDPVTKATTYSDKYCVAGDVTRLTITENALMDGAAAQREIARRRAEESEARQHQLTMRDEALNRQSQQADAYNRYKSAAGKQRVFQTPSKKQAQALASAAMESGRVDAVEDAAKRTGRGKSEFAAKTTAALESCKRALHGYGGNCDSDALPDVPTKRASNGSAVAAAARSGGGPGGSTICPDGSFVSGGSCTLCPNGRYVGGSSGCQLAPDGSYVSRSDEGPRLTPAGTYVQGGRGYSLCPDGSYVAGNACQLAPNGSYVSR